MHRQLLQPLSWIHRVGWHQEHAHQCRFVGTQQRKELCSSLYKTVHLRPHLLLQGHLTKKTDFRVHLSGCKNLR